MQAKKICIFCGAKTDGKRPLCRECETLKAIIKVKNTRPVVRAMEIYNARHGRRFTYGQFVNLCYSVEGKYYENAKTKKERAKKV